MSKVLKFTIKTASGSVYVIDAAAHTIECTTGPTFETRAIDPDQNLHCPRPGERLTIYFAEPDELGHDWLRTSRVVEIVTEGSVHATQ